MLDFTCCYCLKRGPEVEPAIAHIFPDAMGGVSYTRKTVCGACNAQTNQSFEQTEIQKFSFFQGIWGIRSRRKKLKGIPASVDFGGKLFNLYLDERGLPKIPLVLNEKDAAGKKQYSILGPVPKVNEKQKEIEAKIPNIKWTEKELKEGSLPQANIEIASDLGRQSLRRLAAKVAYERWAQLRTSNLLDDSQYNDIRNFILNGSEPNPICGLLFDHRLLSDVLKFPIGQHAVVIIGNPQSPKLGAFIAFYGLWASLKTPDNQSIICDTSNPRRIAHVDTQPTQFF